MATDNLPAIGTSAYMYNLGKSSEVRLEYINAINMYTAALNTAKRLNQASKLYYQWAIDRCAEKAKIKERLEKLVHPTAKVGLIDNEFIWVDWRYAKLVIPDQYLDPARRKVPTDMAEWTVLKYNTVTHSCEFIIVKDFMDSPEPVIGKSVVITEAGGIIKYEGPAEPKVLRHKWAMVDYDQHNKYINRTAWLRRAINVEYLGVPEALSFRTNKAAFFNKYIAPRVGNRHLGKNRQFLYTDAP